jgi:hypothetical protein
LLEAARRSSVVSDGRFVHVLDAAEEQEVVFVVREWVPGESLDAALGQGPLSHRRAAWIVRECSSALAAAHDVGIPHLFLVPQNVWLTTSGGVKIAGLATDAALHELSSADPQADDVRGLGSLLYACLVARWPGQGGVGLPPAPEIASVPVLARSAASSGSSPRTASRRRWRRALLWLAVAVLVAGAALLAFQMGRSGLSAGGNPTEPSPSGSSSGSSDATLQQLRISRVVDFDPVADNGSGDENPDVAPLAIDGDPQTAWPTLEYYGDPQFGGYKKPGVGLVVDLGAAKQVAEVKVRLLGNGTDVQLRVAPSDAETIPESASGFRVVARARQAGTRVALRPSRPVTTRFVLVYLTSLPLVRTGVYQGRVAEISVLG